MEWGSTNYEALLGKEEVVELTQELEVTVR